MHIDEHNEVAWHDEAIEDLRHFSKLEHLDVSVNDIVDIVKMPTSLKTLKLSFVEPSLDGELEALARTAPQRLPNLQRVVLDASCTPTDALRTEFEVIGVQLESF